MANSIEPHLKLEFVRRDHRIDVIRGLAIGIVLVHHFYLAYVVSRTPVTTTWGEIVRAVGRNGNYGVIVFFVISGYLITSTSLRRFGDLQHISARVFYVFRFARIYPCLALVLAIVTLVGSAGVPYFRNSNRVSFFVADLSVLTFWHNVLMARAGWFNYCLNVLWSLSVEEVFYLSFPLLWLCLRKTWLVIAVWIAAIVAAPMYRALHLSDELQYLCSYWACFDAIAMGCCTALMARHLEVNEKTRNIVQALAGLAMVWVYLEASIGMNAVVGPSLMAALTATILLAEAATRTAPSRPRSFASEPVAWFGRHSYELYLFHIIVLAAMRTLISAALTPVSRATYFLIFMTASTLVAWAIARYYSEPLNRQLRVHLQAGLLKAPVKFGPHK